MEDMKEKMYQKMDVSKNGIIKSVLVDSSKVNLNLKNLLNLKNQNIKLTQ
jgi:hypothetical protein